MLCRVHVLVLVHNEVPVLRADLLRDIGMLFDAPNRGAQQVLKVDHPGRAFDPLVGGVDLGHLRRLVRRLAARLHRRDRVVARLHQT